MTPETTFFFYDLETSGFNPRRHRIMQFAGQRTDMDLNPIGEPLNIVVKLTDEMLPSPGAILITGITPQSTVRDGISEAEFMKILHEQAFTPGTIATGFNNIRFDDEFIRYAAYRNFYDAYEWAWADGRSRWDLLDVVRMTRALRPEGINWPVGDNGYPNNKLEPLASANGLEHIKAHDALSDVYALIGLTKLIKAKQPKLFQYLLGLRNKKAVEKLVDLTNPEPFVYSSGNYPILLDHTTIAYPIARGSNPGTVLVYDLRHDPNLYLKPYEKDIVELKKLRFATAEMRKSPGYLPMPAKELAYNKAPAVAPLSVYDQQAGERLKLDKATALRHLETLKASGLAKNLVEVFAREPFPPSTDVDGALYDGFIGDGDKAAIATVRRATTSQIGALAPKFSDKRLPELFKRYKARNFNDALNDDERLEWETYRLTRLGEDWADFTLDMKKASQNASRQQLDILEDVKLWAQSIMPAEEG